MKAYKPPEQKISRASRAISDDWLGRSATGGKAGSDFSYGGPLTELAMLGVIALKLPGTKLEWDGPDMRFTNSDEANRHLNPPYRQGLEPVGIDDL